MSYLFIENEMFPLQPVTESMDPVNKKKFMVSAEDGLRILELATTLTDIPEDQRLSVEADSLTYVVRNNGHASIMLIKEIDHDDYSLTIDGDATLLQLLKIIGNL